MPTIQELIDQKSQLLDQVAEIDKQIAQAQSEHRNTAIAEIRALMSKAGLSLADITGAGPSEAPVRKRRAAAEKTSKVAAKYRDAETGNTWSGRGLKPRWLTAALAAGKTIEDFAI